MVVVLLVVNWLARWIKGAVIKHEEEQRVRAAGNRRVVQLLNFDNGLRGDPSLGTTTWWNSLQAGGGTLQRSGETQTAVDTSHIHPSTPSRVWAQSLATVAAMSSSLCRLVALSSRRPARCPAQAGQLCMLGIVLNADKQRRQGTAVLQQSNQLSSGRDTATWLRRS
jgi:hypothetical protein